jgi:hypothetical protein
MKITFTTSRLTCSVVVGIFLCADLIYLSLYPGLEMTIKPSDVTQVLPQVSSQTGLDLNDVSQSQFCVQVEVSVHSVD